MPGGSIMLFAKTCMRLIRYGSNQIGFDCRRRTAQPTVSSSASWCENQQIGMLLKQPLAAQSKEERTGIFTSSPDCISVACFCCSHVAKNKYCRSVMISFKRLRHRRRPRTTILVWYSPLATLSCNYTLLMRVYLPGWIIKVGLLSKALVIFIITK